MVLMSCPNSCWRKSTILFCFGSTCQGWTLVAHMRTQLPLVLELVSKYWRLWLGLSAVVRADCVVKSSIKEAAERWCASRRVLFVCPRSYDVSVKDCVPGRAMLFGLSNAEMPQHFYYTRFATHAFHSSCRLMLKTTLTLQRREGSSNK
jgi:hypothetical protein